VDRVVSSARRRRGRVFMRGVVEGGEIADAMDARDAIDGCRDCRKRGVRFVRF